MLQVRFGKADIAGAAHAKGTHSLSEIVASIPSRSAYCLAKAGVFCRRRVAWSASCWACGRMVRVRRLYFFSERIQWTWRGQRPQSVVENLILITSLVRLSMAGVQLILRCPSGQIACWRSQSMTNWLASMPCSVLACHFTSPRAGPITSIPY